jgi:hypothetical protein
LKVAFDLHVPAGMVRVFQALASEKKMLWSVSRSRKASDRGELVVVSAKTYEPDPTDADYIKRSDAPWLERFAKDGGDVVISGDTRMYEKPHEVVAIQRTGLVLVLFENRWNGWDFFRKSALLLWHWLAVIEATRKATDNHRGKAASAFRVPAAWPEEVVLKPLPPPGQLLMDFNRRAKKSVKPQRSYTIAGQLQRRKRHAPSDVSRQGTLPLDGKGSRGK